MIHSNKKRAILRRFRSGFKIWKIAEDFDLPPATIVRILKDFGLTRFLIRNRF